MIRMVGAASASASPLPPIPSKLRDRGVEIGQPLIVRALLAGLAMNGDIFHVACMKAAKPMRLDRQRNAPFNQVLERQACQNGPRSRKSIEKHVCWHNCATVEQHYATPHSKRRR